MGAQYPALGCPAIRAHVSDSRRGLHASMKAFDVTDLKSKFSPKSPGSDVAIFSLFTSAGFAYGQGYGEHSPDAGCFKFAINSLQE